MTISFDLCQALEHRVDGLHDSGQRQGFFAVLRHVEAAVRHRERGARDNDDSSFCDAILRANQAFEGALREAYRVLSGQPHHDASLGKIEHFLESRQLLRQRVLKQMRAYRTDWRNPSTHDHRLTYSEHEALLASVSVAVFAIVLVDQIVQHNSYVAAKAAADTVRRADHDHKPFVETLVDAMHDFDPAGLGVILEADHKEYQFLGALAGYLEGEFPESSALADVALSPAPSDRVDLLLRAPAGTAVIEIMRGRIPAGVYTHFEPLLQQLMKLAAAEVALLVFLDARSDKDERSVPSIVLADAAIFVFYPPSHRER